MGRGLSYQQDAAREAWPVPFPHVGQIPTGKGGLVPHFIAVHLVCTFWLPIIAHRSATWLFGVVSVTFLPLHIFSM